MSTASPGPTLLRCPRCGYDVSGVVPTWTTACPLEGRCSECGLSFQWVDIYVPERLFPSWSIEHCRRRRIRAFFATLKLALQPRRLWSQMPLALPIKLSRLAVFVAACLLLTHTMEILIAEHLVSRWTIMTTVSPMGVRTAVRNWQVIENIAAWPYLHYLGSWPIVSLVGPLGQFLLLWAFLAPMPYLILAQTMRRARSRPAHLARAWAHFLPTMCLVLLGDTFFVNLANLGPQWLSLQYFPSEIWAAIFLIAALPIVWWYVRWWWHFTRDYLQLEQPRLVVTLMMTVSCLAALAICTTCSNGLIDLVGAIIAGIGVPIG